MQPGGQLDRTAIENRSLPVEQHTLQTIVGTDRACEASAATEMTPHIMVNLIS